MLAVKMGEALAQDEKKNTFLFCLEERLRPGVILVSIL